MKLDCHTHIFPPEMIAARERHLADEPAFALLYGAPDARMATAEGLLAVMDRDGVDRAVTFGFPWEREETAKRHNDYVLEAAARYAPRLIPLACMAALAPWAPREAARSLLAGHRGLGELALYGPCEEARALDALSELFALSHKARGLVLLHANEPVGRLYPGKSPLQLDFYYALARRSAGRPLILAHWGGGLGFFGLLKKEAPEVLSHVYYDTAASPYLYSPGIYPRMAGIVGIERVLFGSDFPLLAPSRYFREMAEAGLSAQETAAVCGGNAERLLATGA